MTRRLSVFIGALIVLFSTVNFFPVAHAATLFDIPRIVLNEDLRDPPKFQFASLESSSLFTDAIIRKSAVVDSASSKSDLVEATPSPSPTPFPTPVVVPQHLNDTQFFVGEYFDNASVSGTPVSIKEDAAIDFAWAYTTPVPEITSPSYSVRWRKVDTFTKGIWRFHVTASGGVRIFIDDTNVFDTQIDSVNTSDIDVPVTDGTHTIWVEYVAQTENPTIHVTWEYIPNAQPPERYIGEYFDNQTLSGLPAVMRTDAAIDFDWGKESPEQSIPDDHFSVRWTQKTQFTGGTYRFSATADDGVRLKIDGILYIDTWHDTASSHSNADVVITGGYHTVTLEYYENTGNAFAHLSWNIIALLPTTAVTGEYFGNTTLSGTPIYTASYPITDFDWGEGSPDPSVPADQFSARLTKTEAFVEGTYRFQITADDGVRIFLDDKNIFDAWKDQSLATYTFFHPITSGTHTIVIEYYDRYSTAVLKALWTKVDGPSQEMFDAAYFDNRTLEGTPMLLRKDKLILFDWKNGSPDTSIPNDNFSVRWTKTAAFEGGRYRFSATTDDGVRVYVDNVPLINEWKDQHTSTFTVDTTVAAGNHSVRVEYYEHIGTAKAIVDWKKL